MKCEICGRGLAKNGVKNGVQYYLCTHCKKSYSGKPHEPNHHIFEEYITRLLFWNCVKRINKFTQTKWTKNQIARLLGHHHRDIKKWIDKSNLPKINRNEFISYLENRENGFDILCVLGFRTAIAPSDNLNRIIHRKERERTPKVDTNCHLSEAEYFRLINMPLTNRRDAIFVLGALLGCRTSEIIGVKYSDINYIEKTIRFNRIVTFEYKKEKEIYVIEQDRRITNRKYPLTDRMLEIIKWLEIDSKRNCQKLGKAFKTKYNDFLCIKENGDFITSFALNKHTQDIREKLNITSEFLHCWKSKDNIYESIKKFKFKWLRYSVKLMMLKAGVSESDVKIIFGYKNSAQNVNQLEIMRKAYDVLDKYIDENMGKYPTE